MTEEIEQLEQKLGQMKKEETHRHFVENMTKWGADPTEFTCEYCKENYWVKKENGVVVSARCNCEGWCAEECRCCKCGVLVDYHLYAHDYGYEGKTSHKHLRLMDYESEYIDYKTDRFMCENCFNLKAIRLEQEVKNSKASAKSFENERQKAERNVKEVKERLKTFEKKLEDAKKSWKSKELR